VDPFIQGSGLGLTLCRLLVEKMGGQIWVRSKENEGSIFYFTLPVTE
jgi:signal transduction histidine kinase